MMAAPALEALHAALQRRQHLALGGSVLPQPTMPTPNWSLTGQNGLQFAPPMAQGLPQAAPTGTYQTPSVMPMVSGYDPMARAPSAMTPSDIVQLMQMATQASPAGSAVKS